MNLFINNVFYAVRLVWAPLKLSIVNLGSVVSGSIVLE